ncbi:hypothetical protein TNCV_1796391 [Trichonephila clavipes]|nr:hypothetical protein TNCV_1796391 [Trichonephila clavipes]
MSPALPLDLLPKTRPPLLIQVSNTMNITVPDRGLKADGCSRGTSTQNQPQKNQQRSVLIKPASSEDRFD